MNGLSDALFGRLTSFLQQRTGILLKNHKKYLVVSRLASLVGAGKRYTSFEDLYQALQSDEGPLLQKFINVLTTNFSYFFRDPVHFAVMAQYLKERAGGENYLRFWSAASSTGEEAFSMAITLANHGGMLPSDRRILATDISTKVLSQAQTAVYPGEAVLTYVEPADRERYFATQPDGRFAVKPSLRSLVDFRLLNLQSSFPFQKEMDIVFLRNVMIYFGPEERESVLDKVYDAMKPGGVLFVGLSESLSGVSHRFRSYRESVFMKTR